MTILTFFMMIWMYATRIPASKTLEDQGVNLEDLSHPSKLGGVFPSKVERVADNYNHLFEQPTVFYAISFIIWALNMTDLQCGDHKNVQITPAREPQHAENSEHSSTIKQMIFTP